MHSTRWVLNIHFSVNCIGRLNCVLQCYLIHVTFRAHIQPGFTLKYKQLWFHVLVYVIYILLQFDIM